MLSYIQNKILAELLKTNETRYSDSIPSGVDKNLFNYHLSFLIKKGYVKKGSGKYILTEFGKKYVQQLDVKGNYKKYFKFSVLVFVTIGVQGTKQLLVHKRLRHPYFNDINVISGKVLYGEEVTDAASRKLKEESELECKNFKFLGVHRKTRYDSEKRLIEDTLYHCCVGKNPNGILNTNNDFGEFFWATFDEVIKLTRNNKAFCENDIKLIERVRDDVFDLFYWHDIQHLKDF